MKVEGDARLNVISDAKIARRIADDVSKEMF